MPRSPEIKGNSLNYLSLKITACRQPGQKCANMNDCLLECYKLLSYLYFLAVLVRLLSGSLILLVLLVQPSITCGYVQVEHREYYTDASKNQRDYGRGKSATCKHRETLIHADAERAAEWPSICTT